METAFNEEYSFEELPKKARLVEFMYTNCPDVCPVTTLEMSKLRHSLEKEGVFGDEVEFITITIDPNHDTQEILKDYAIALKFILLTMDGTSYAVRKRRQKRLLKHLVSYTVTPEQVILFILHSRTF